MIMDLLKINKFIIKLFIIWLINNLNRSIFVFGNLDNPFFTMTMEPIKNSPENCYRRVKKCIPLNQTLQCLDVSLTYKFTSYSSLFEQSSSLSTLMENHQELIDRTRQYLERWKGLQSIPQCWKSLQTALCASFFPRCDDDSSRVILPTYEMCRLIRGPCRIIDEHYYWPSFLQCENQTFFSTKCPNSYTDLKFSSTMINNRCPSRLVSTDDKNIFYPGFDGCSLHCINPLYSNEQYDELDKLITYGTISGLMLTLFAICSFLINRKCLKRRFYSSVIFYLNLCMLMTTTGWMLQLFKTRNDIVCRQDNTIRYGEPSKSDHFYCCFSFLLIYYFSLSASIWFVHLYRVFYKTFYGLSTGMKMNFNKFHFHMFAWSIPLILTILIFLLGEIDADPLRGICFVGIRKPIYRIIFVLLPITICIFTGLYHAFRTMIILFKAKQKCQKQNSRRNENINWALLRIVFFSTSILLIFLVTSGTYFYELYINDDNLKRFNDHLVCELNISAVLQSKNDNFTILNNNNYYYDDNYNNNNNFDNNNNNDGFVNSCRQYQSPNIWYIYLQLIAIFCAPFLTSSWIWTRATISTWRRFLKRQLCNSSKETKESLRLKPYELIANSYQKREQIQQGLYVPSLISNHNDPVDMDINSAQSQSVSTNFQQNFQTLLNRRYAIWSNNGNVNTNNVNDNNNIINNNNNNDNLTFLKHHKNIRQSNINNNNSIRSSSFISQNLSMSDISQQHYSFESLEQQQHQQTTTTTTSYHRNQRRKKKKEREKRLFTRRDSDTSGSIISSAFTTNKSSTNNNNNRLRTAQRLSTTNQSKNLNSFVTKSTSTGDLFDILFSNVSQPPLPPLQPPPPPAIINGYNPYAMAMMQQTASGPLSSQPFLTPAASTMAPNSSILNQMHTSPIHGHTIPMMNVSNCPSISTTTTTTTGGIRMQKDQCVSSFAFTHGMYDQTDNKIVNPMLEKRRPESSISTAKQQSNVDVGFSNLVVVNQASTSSPFSNVNYMMNPMSTNHATINHTAPVLYPYNHQLYANNQATAALIATAAYGGGNYSHLNSSASSTTATVPSHMIAAAAAASLLPRYYNTQAAFLAYQQSKSMTEMENFMREHEKFKSLITAHQTDTESNSELLPINLTESESSRNGYYSDDHQQLKQSRLLVQERMKKVEDEIDQKLQQQQINNDNDNKTNDNS